jgi:hypothetical protein
LKRSVGVREELHDLGGYRIDANGGDDVAREGFAIDVSAAIDGGGGCRVVNSDSAAIASREESPGRRD